MSWDALSLAGAHTSDAATGIAHVAPTSASYAASVAASDLAALGLPPLPASVRRIELAVECHADDAARGVLPAWASASGVELWVDVGERATAAEVGRWLSGAGVDADSGPPTAEHAADAAGRARELCEVVRALLGVSLDGCRGARPALARWLQPVPRALWRAGLFGAGGVDAAAAAEERGGGGGPARARPAAAHVALGYFASSAVEERGAAAACAAPLGLLRAGGDLGGTDGADGALPRFFHAAAASWWSGERGGAALPAWGVHRLRVIVEAGDDAHPLRHAERHAALSHRDLDLGRFHRPQQPAAGARAAAARLAVGEVGCLPRAAADGARLPVALRRGHTPRSGLALQETQAGPAKLLLSGAARQGDAADGTDFGVAGAAGARLHAACAPAAGGLDRGVAALRRRLDGDGFHRRLSSTVRVPAQLLAGLGDGEGARGCSRWALVERLPPSVLVDAWQLRRLQRLGDGALGPATEGVVDFVPDDIEAPAERSAQAVLVARGALIFDGGGALLNVSLPLHARYAAPAADGGSHRPLRLPPPLLFLRCDGGGAAADEPLLCPPAALARAIGAAADCEGGGGGGAWRAVPVVDAEAGGGIVEASVPVGQQAHALAVLAVTVAAMVAGTLLMLETLATAKQREETLELAAARLH